MVCEIYLIRTNTILPKFVPLYMSSLLFNAESDLVCKGVVEGRVGSGVGALHSSAHPIPSAEAQPGFCCNPCLL